MQFFRSFALFGAAMTVSLFSSLSQAQKTMPIPGGPLVGYSLDWLAAGGQASSLPKEIYVYSLSCGKCIEELAAISNGQSIAPDLFALTTFRAIDRRITIPFLALGLSLKDPKQRRSEMLDLLRLYTADADHYLENADDWKTIVEGRWPSGTSEQDDALAWAFATNVADMSARILALSGRLGAPDTISLESPVLAAEVKRGSDRYKALIHTLGLSWMRPELEDEILDTIDERIRFVNPLVSLSQNQWKDLKKWANEGSYWLWGGQLSGPILSAITDWEASYLLLPNDEARMERFNEWFDDTIERAGGGDLSPMDAFGITDMAALASPAWNAAQSDAMEHLRLASIWGRLLVSD